MQIDDIKQTDLIQSERDVLKEDAARWMRMGAGSHLDEWLAYGPGLMIRRRLAMRLAHTNKPEGKGYALAFAELMKSDGLDHMDKTSVSAVLWLGDEPGRIQMLREMREAMTPGERSRLNSPITARKRVENAVKARGNGSEESVPTSPVARLKEAMLIKDREITELQLKIARQVDGSLFDLKRDNAEDIARVIVASISDSKAKNIASAIAERLRQKQQRHAG